MRVVNTDVNSHCLCITCHQYKEEQNWTQKTQEVVLRSSEITQLTRTFDLKITSKKNSCVFFALPRGSDLLYFQRNQSSCGASLVSLQLGAVICALHLSDLSLKHLEAGRTACLRSFRVGGGLGGGVINENNKTRRDGFVYSAAPKVGATRGDW